MVIGIFLVDWVCKLLGSMLCIYGQILFNDISIFLFPFDRWENWGSEKLSNLLQITARTLTQGPKPTVITPLHHWCSCQVLVSCAFSLSQLIFTDKKQCPKCSFQNQWQAKSGVLSSLLICISFLNLIRMKTINILHAYRKIWRHGI